MNYKIEGSIRRNRTNFIIYALIWVILAIVVIPAFSYSGAIASETGIFNLSTFLTTFISSLTNPIKTIGGIFTLEIIGDYIGQLLIVTVIYSIFMFIGMVRTAPKNQYTDIEHGSSDWSQHGEQYKIISKNKGIILAENNYLPVNKRGNVNVLVVGRFRVW